MKKLSLIGALLALTAVTLFNGCGYKLAGFSNQIPDHIRTIAIPDFENTTTRYQADQYITFAVRDEFIKRSKMKLVEQSADPDAVLEGVIENFSVKPISYSDEASANLYRISISVSVRLIDLKTNEIIFEGKRISFNDTYSIESGVDIEEDFFSQETETLIKISEEFAGSIVTTIMENF